MKKTLLQTALVMLVCLSCTGLALAAQTVSFNNSETSVALLNQDPNSLTMQVEIGAVDLNSIATKEGSFVMMNVEGFSRSYNIGEPNLPMVNRLLSIPYDATLQATVIDYTVEEFSLTDLGFTEQLMPSQPPLSKSTNPDLVAFAYDKDSYKQSGYYSLPLTETKVMGTLRSHQVGKVSISPFAYDPILNKVRVYTSLTIQVDFVGGDWTATEAEQRRCYSPYFEAVYSRLLNYDDDYPVILDDLVSYPVTFVIISNRMFEDQLEPVIEWKTKKGFTVITAYTDEIGSTNTAIRNYINDLYDTQTPPPSFVLFVGDDEQIPAFDGDAGSHITDLRFCEFTGDDMPEIYYGRWSAQSTDELQPQIDKSLEYEMYTMPDPSYLGEVSLVAGVDASYAPIWGNGQINYGTDYYFNTAHGIEANVWLYPESDESGAEAAILETMNAGIGLVNYSAHCGHDGWGDPAVTSDDIRDMTNEDKYYLSIGNCCLSNTFGSDYSTPCFGEVWLQEEGKGGIGHIGGSNSTYWDEDYWWGVGAGDVVVNPTYEETGLGAYDGLFHDHDEDATDYYITNDALIFCGNLAVVEGGSSMDQYYWEIYHIMGDPSIISYMGVPSNNTISHAETVMLTAPSFAVQADAGSYVGISMDGVLYGQGYVDETGLVDIELTAFPAPGTADIVITAQNKVPYISTITVVTPEGAYVIYDTHVVDDTDGGNGNGLVDFGESIVLDMQLKNVGPDDASGVDAVLSTEDTLVTITDNTASFGDIAGDYDTANVADAYAFEVSEDTEDGHIISFVLTVTDDDNNTWTSRFSITVHAPELEFVEIISDDSQGNGDGIIDPDETIEIVATVLNNGSAIAENVTAVISTTDEYVTITDADGSFGDIATDGQASNSDDIFAIHTSSDFPAGHSMLFNMTVTTDGGYTATMSFTLRAVESFEYNNAGWDGEGVWEWGVPTSGPGSAYDGDNVWGTVLDGEYPSNADDNLITTYYTITSPSATISFYHWYQMESSWDGGNVSISTDGGDSWDLLTPDGGYPEDDLDGLDDESGFSGSSGGWEEVYFDLADYYGDDVCFRFRFGSDGSVTYDGWYIDAVVLTGAISWGANFPTITITPQSLSTSLDPGDSVTYALTIGNTGNVALNYSAAVVTNDIALNNSGSSPSDPIFDSYIEKYKADGLSYYNYVGPKTETENTPSGNLITETGGPDDFGYTWIDSDEDGGPTYSWIDITDNGILLEGLDDDMNVGEFNIGFSFPYYSEEYTTFRVCSNGWISFTSTSTSSYTLEIPTGDDPYNMIAPYWGDLNPSNDYGSGDVYYWTNNVDTLIVSYVDIPYYLYDGPNTFQIILTADGNIVFQYAEINEPLDSYATGIQNGDATIGLQVAYHDATYLHSGLAVKIKYPLSWLTVSPTSGSVDPNESTNLSVTFNAVDLSDGIYIADIIIESNDPANSSIAVPCTLYVGIVSIGDGDAATLPTAFTLNQNYPNPFNPTTEIAFGLPTAGLVNLAVYDVMGRKVATLANEEMVAGTYTIIWNGMNSYGDKVTSGVYFYKLTSGENTITKKMIMLK